MTPYKAWEVFVIDHEDEGHEIAYADTRNEAKYKLLDGECKTCGNLCADSNLEYLDLSARRLKACDGLGDEPVSVVLEAAIKGAGWTCNIDGVEYSADDISDEESLEEFRSLFYEQEATVQERILKMQEKPRTEQEIGDEALVMSYLDILKYAKHHCPDSEDPYEITDRIFIDVMKANSGTDQQ